MSILTIIEMRKSLKKSYNNALSWNLKVDKMDDMQVLAIWSRVSREGKKERS